METLLLVSLKNILIVLGKLKFLLIGLVLLRLLSYVFDWLRIRKYFKVNNLKLKSVIPAPFKRLKTVKKGSGRPYSVSYSDSNSSSKRALILTNAVKGVIFVEE